MEFDPDSLFRRLDSAHSRDLPPVHLWNPTVVQDAGMRIDRNGTWIYRGTPITRHRMVRLFSTILRREGDDFYLVTPTEKVRVEVETAPFLAIRMESRSSGEGREIAFETNVGDLVIADERHPIRVDHGPDGPSPRVEVRSGLEALLTRSVYYDLAVSGEPESEAGIEVLVVRSRGSRFVLGSLED